MQKTQRQLQKEKTKSNIIEAAFIQFAKNGIIATKTSDIANAANVSHGTIFSHFPSKEILIDEVIEAFKIIIASRLHELSLDSCKLEDILKAHLIGISEYEDFYTRLILESRMLNNCARNAVIALQSTIAVHILDVVEEDMKADFIKNMPLDMFFNTWLGLVHHYLLNSDLFGREGLFYERQGKMLIEHFLNLVRK
ncbi:MAG: TetR/AcrR family transcriptional regulator [Proteocatella sp.]